MRVPCQLIIVLALLPALAGCRYTFIPLVPQNRVGELPNRLTGASLVRKGETLEVRARLQDPRQRGYLTVIWYRGDTELARDNTYLDELGPNATFTLNAPDKANYRAVLSFEGQVLRQLDLPEVGGV